ncbi:MAG TPA: hypothetical protein VFG76_02375, partial [Candidatus Polarisedimenticolia bacterium]|nr:hypothetical protein [Candidatus Polarisedimenticolia bacterium]
DPSETKGGTTLPMQEVETCVPEVGNDLEEAAFKLLPLLGTLKQRLVRSGALAAALTGSGSALFGIHASAEDLQRSAASLAASLADEGAAVFACRTLTRDEYHRRMFTGTRK